MTDEQLRRMLQDVEVPEGLKAGLKNIPDQKPEHSGTGIQSPQRFVWQLAGVAALAASIVGLAAFAFHPNAGDQPEIARADSTDSNSLKAPEPTDEFSATEILEQMKSQALDIDFLVFQQDFEDVIEGFGQRIPVEQIATLKVEQKSVAMFAAVQTGANYGGDLGTIREELNQVKLQFPGTRGAKLADQFIENSNLKSEF